MVSGTRTVMLVAELKRPAARWAPSRRDPAAGQLLDPHADIGAKALACAAP
jgi:hypothetical protein